MTGIENLQPSLNVNGIMFYQISYPKDIVAHNETAATAWRQRNADWWSDIKKTNQNNSTSAKS